MSPLKRSLLFIAAMAVWFLLYTFVIQPYLFPTDKTKKTEPTKESAEKSKEPTIPEKEKNNIEEVDSASGKEAEKKEVSEEEKKGTDVLEENKETEPAKTTEVKDQKKGSLFDLFDKEFEYISGESEQGRKAVYRYSADNGIIITKTITINKPSKDRKEDDPKDNEPYITNLTISIENTGTEEFKQKGYLISAGTVSMLDPDPKIADIGIFAQSASNYFFKPRNEIYTDLQAFDGIATAGITNKYFATIIESATEDTRKSIKRVVINSFVPSETPEKGSDGALDDSAISNEHLGFMVQPKGASVLNFILIANDIVRGRYDATGKMERGKNLSYHPTIIPDEHRPFAMSAYDIEPEKEKTQVKLLQYSIALGIGEITIPSGGKTEYKFRLYVGPKEYRRLKRLGYEHAMSFNRYLKPINVALLSILHWFYSIIPNYGVAIILLTIVIKIVLWPLDQKSYKSMKEMQKIQPLIAEVKEKYKDDPKKAQIKQMELFREHKVNPLGGCLPMLLQFPILFAMFSTLRVGFELRGAPFFWWIDDLSQPDILVKFKTGIWFFKSLNILPLFMVAVFYVQQKLSATAPKNPNDPQYKQQQMMNRIFPIMFGFIFYNMQSGLTLYFAFSTLLRIIQQLLVIKKPDTSSEISISGTSARGA